MPGTKALKSAAMGPVSEEMAPITMSDCEPDPPEVAVVAVVVVVVVLLAAPGLELEQPARRAAAKSTAVTVPANREVVFVWSRMLPHFAQLCAHMMLASTILALPDVQRAESPDATTTGPQDMGCTVPRFPHLLYAARVRHLAAKDWPGDRRECACLPIARVDRPIRYGHSVVAIPRRASLP